MEPLLRQPQGREPGYGFESPKIPLEMIGPGMFGRIMVPYARVGVFVSWRLSLLHFHPPRVCGVAAQLLRRLLSVQREACISRDSHRRG